MLVVGIEMFKLIKGLKIRLDCDVCYQIRNEVASRKDVPAEEGGQKRGPAEIELLLCPFVRL